MTNETCYMWSSTDFPHSERCEKLATIWKELAERYSHQPHLIFAEMDGTVNDAEGVVIKALPRLIYFPRNSDEVGHTISYASRN